jgi:hypothetical protein
VPGSNQTTDLYIKNLASSSIISLSVTAENYTPQEAASYLMVSLNFSSDNLPLAPEDSMIVQLVLSVLSVAANATQGQAFSFVVVLTATFGGGNSGGSGGGGGGSWTSSQIIQSSKNTSNTASSNSGLGNLLIFVAVGAVAYLLLGGGGKKRR